MASRIVRSPYLTVIARADSRGVTWISTLLDARRARRAVGIAKDAYAVVLVVVRGPGYRTLVEVLLDIALLARLAGSKTSIMLPKA